MNAPRGINLMWNTSFLLPGVVLAPVTLLAGAQTSLTIMLTLGMAGSAASLFWVLRRWGASMWAAALGGALYGFSPAIVNSGIGHYHLAFAVAPPLIIDAMLRIVTGRGHPVRTGIWLGLLTAAQLFTGEELLADTALTSLVLIAVLAAGYWREVLVKARNAALGLATGLAVVLLIGGYALWAQFHGPLGQHKTPGLPNPVTNKAAFFVNPSAALLFHAAPGAASAAAYGRGLSEYLAYLGWPLLVVLVAASIRYFRDPKVRAAAVTWAALELLSFGGGTMTSGKLVPPARVAAAVPLAAERTGAQPGAAGPAVHPRGRCRGGGAGVLAGPCALGATAGLELAAGHHPGRDRGHRAPAADPGAVPSGPGHAGAGLLQTAFTRLKLPAGDRVLVVPVPDQRYPEVLRWVADTGEPASVIGGYFVGPNKGGQQVLFTYGPTTTAAQDLDGLWNGGPGAGLPPRGLLRSDLGYWRPAAVVAVTSLGSRLGRYLISLFGRPTFEAGQVLAWRLPADAGR